MQIREITVYQVDLPLHEGTYNWSGGKSVTVFDSTVVRVATDAGVVGHQTPGRHSHWDWQGNTRRARCCPPIRLHLPYSLTG